MAKLKVAVAILGDNNLKVQYPADCSLNDLVKIVEQELSMSLLKIRESPCCNTGAMTLICI